MFVQASGLYTIIPIVQMGKLRPKGVKWLAKGPTAGKQQSQNWNPGFLILKPPFCLYPPLSLKGGRISHG